MYVILAPFFNKKLTRIIILKNCKKKLTIKKKYIILNTNITNIELFKG